MTINLRGYYSVQLIVSGKVVATRHTENGITNAGKNALLNTYIGTPSWYFGLIASGASLNASDTMGSHPGWTELTAYGGNRQSAVFSTPATNSKLTSDNASFGMTAAGNVSGAFLCSSESGTGGTLWSTGLFNTLAIPDAGILEVRYTLTVQ